MSSEDMYDDVACNTWATIYNDVTAWDDLNKVILINP